jgi:hypothetical protein
MGKLARHCAADATARTVEIIERQPERFKRPRKRLGYRAPEECYAQS